MKTHRILAALSLLSFIACNSPVTRNVLIIGRGKLTVTDNNVTMNDGSGYAEQTVDIRGDKPETWNVTTPTGKTAITIPEEKGFYLLNLKTDTLIGSEQIMGTDISNPRTITQEELKIKIDSLTKLTKGDNVEFGGRNFFVLPKQIIKVSKSTEARVFGPYNKIPASLEVDKNGNTPEIYKFYTNTEMRQLIKTFKEMTY